jgi:hypothetical protein
MKRRKILFMFTLAIALGALLLLTVTSLARRGGYIRIDEPNIEPVEACTNSIEFGFALEDAQGDISLLWEREDAPSSIPITATVRISNTGEVVAATVFSAEIVKPALQVLVEGPPGTTYTATHYWIRNEVAIGDPDYITGTTLENGNIIITWSEPVTVGTQLAVRLETEYINTESGDKLFRTTPYPNYDFDRIEEFITKSCAVARIYVPLVLRNSSGSPSPSPEPSPTPPPTFGLPVDEGFEGDLVPPSGWTRVQTNPRDTWKIYSAVPFTGTYAADCEYDDLLAYQNEVLLSPEFQASSAQLQFFSFGNLYWCRDTFDNCDLSVWLVIGDWGGGDDILVHTADEDWVATWQWSLTSVDLTPYLPDGTPVRVALQYEGLDGAQIGLDAISIVEGSVPGEGITPPAGDPVGGRDSRSRTRPVEDEN